MGERAKIVQKWDGEAYRMIDRLREAAFIPSAGVLEDIETAAFDVSRVAPDVFMVVALPDRRSGGLP